MLTDCCPNYPSEDVASILRLAKAVRGFFLEIRSNLTLVHGSNRYQSCWVRYTKTFHIS